VQIVGNFGFCLHQVGFERLELVASPADFLHSVVKTVVFGCRPQGQIGIGGRQFREQGQLRRLDRCLILAGEQRAMGKAGKTSGHDGRIRDELRPCRGIAQQLFLQPLGNRQTASIACLCLTLLRHHFCNPQIPDHAVTMSFRQGRGQTGKDPLRQCETPVPVIKTKEMMGIGQFGQIYPGVTGLQIRFHFLDSGQVELSGLVIGAELVKQHGQLDRRKAARRGITAFAHLMRIGGRIALDRQGFFKLALGDQNIGEHRKGIVYFR